MDVADKEYAAEQIDNTIAVILRILFYLVLWAGILLAEKVLIMYLTIHFHYRANNVEIMKSKRLVDTLVKLYEYSYAVYPRGRSCFAAEDYVIFTAHNSSDGHKSFAMSSMGAVDKITGNFTQAFGIVFGSESTSHWFAPRSQYAIVNEALKHPAASAALAKRLWLSVASEGSDVLTLQDVKDALGPSHAGEAAAC